MNMGIRRGTMQIINMMKMVQFLFHKGKEKNHQSEYGEYVSQFLHATKIIVLIEYKPF